MTNIAMMTDYTMSRLNSILEKRRASIYISNPDSLKRYKIRDLISVSEKKEFRIPTISGSGKLVAITLNENTEFELESSVHVRTEPISEGDIVYTVSGGEPSTITFYKITRRTAKMTYCREMRMKYANGECVPDEDAELKEDVFRGRIWCSNYYKAECTTVSSRSAYKWNKAPLRCAQPTEDVEFTETGQDLVTARINKLRETIQSAGYLRVADAGKALGIERTNGARFLREYVYNNPEFRVCFEDIPMRYRGVIIGKRMRRVKCIRLAEVKE